ncbi:uncharacterized protein LOC132704503 [Cylas formicarius]|uniref:uncharacterized protein LOC132704503 n=1 Tax=Cylas formicarius TaxID=197179 RepID=UPI0029583454|nr:uncharacterized protein LOC132704503 [Cylas formicarius]
MADAKPLYSTCVAVLGFVCFVVGATAVGIPMWGYFDTLYDGSDSEKGYFGPWKTCKWLLYNREKCGWDSTRFKPSILVYVAGVMASMGVAILGVFCILTVLQLAMISSKEKVVMKYSAVLITKVVLALLAALLAVATAIVFAVQIDGGSRNNGFEVTRGPAFYIQVLAIIIDATLFVMALYDMLFSRREGGDPTNVPVPVEPTTYGNPGYRDRGTNGVGISMTDASGKPYTGASNGSMASMNTTSTTIGSTNGSTVGSSSVGMSRSPPLRSSLKKPKPKDGLGIQNPGYSGTSPTLSRNGSTKKVRIQTHSTEV